MAKTTKLPLIAAAIVAAGVAETANANILKDGWNSVSKAATGAWKGIRSGAKAAGNYVADAVQLKKAVPYATIKTDIDWQSATEKDTALGGETGTEVIRQNYGGSLLGLKSEFEGGASGINGSLDVFARIDNTHSVIPHLGSMNGSLDTSLYSLGAGLRTEKGRYFAAFPLFGSDFKNINDSYAGAPLKVRMYSTGTGVLLGYDTPKGFRILGHLVGFDGKTHTTYDVNPTMTDKTSTTLAGAEVRIPLDLLTARVYGGVRMEKTAGQDLDTSIYGASLEREIPLWKTGVKANVGLGAEYSTTASDLGKSKNTNIGAIFGLGYGFRGRGNTQ